MQPIFRQNTFPIFLKELRPLMRSGKAFWFLMILLLIAGGIFIVFFADERGRLVQTPSYRAHLGRELFLLLSLIQMCFLGLISPILTASAISGERERRTLDLLRITGISAASIFWGKLGSALAYQALLVVCLLPILTMVFMLGGVGLDEVIFNAFMIFQVIVVYGMFGLAISSLCRKSTHAIVATVGSILLMALGIPLLVFVASELHSFGLSPRRTGQVNAIDFADLLLFGPSPIFSWFQIIDQVAMSGRSGQQITASLWLSDIRFMSHITFQTLLGVSSFFVARWGLERRESVQVRQAKKIIDDAQVLEKRRNRFPYYMIDPLRRALPIGDRQNPVFIKEKRVGTLASSTAVIRVCYITVFFSLFASFFLLDLDLKELQMTLSLEAFGLTVIGLPIIAGGIISREREESTLDLLVCTPMSPFQIVWAKYLAVMRFVLPVALSTLPLPILLYLLLSPMTVNNYSLYGSWMMYAMAVLGMGGRVVLFLVASLSLYALVPIYYSSKHRKSIMAIMISFMAVGALIMMPSILLVFLNDLSYVLKEMRVDSSLQLQNTFWDPWPLIWIVGGMQKIIVNLGPVISPYYEFVTTGEKHYAYFVTSGEVHHVNPDLVRKIYTWKWAVFQAVALVGVTLVLLRLAGWRLKRSIEKNK